MENFKKQWVSPVCRVLTHEELVTRLIEWGAPLDRNKALAMDDDLLMSFIQWWNEYKPLSCSVGKLQR